MVSWYLVDHCEDLFVSKEILTVYQLHVYELLKSVLRLLTENHEKTCLNEIL